jgi:thiamine pyrophosphate-dependent acetolactate synthase large subunit-like protein
MADMTHENIERIWNSLLHYLPERTKSDAAIDFVKSLEDIGVEEEEIKASAEYDVKLEEAINTVFEKNEEEDYDSEE